eukprot:1917187-Rhodomonas_salina.1
MAGTRACSGRTDARKCFCRKSVCCYEPSCISLKRCSPYNRAVLIPAQALGDPSKISGQSS